MDDRAEVSDSSHTLDPAADDSVVEAIEMTFGQATLKAIWSALVTTGWITGLIFGMFLAINILSVFGNGLPPLKNALMGSMYFLLFSFCLIGFPVGMFQSRRWRPRRISVQEGDIVVETKAKTIRRPIQQWTWKLAGRVASDRSGAYPPNGPRLVLTVRPKSTKQPEELFSFACGWTPESFEMWTRFLMRHDVLAQKPSSILMSAARFCAAGGVGALVGAIAGMVVDGLLVKPIAVVGLGLVGLIDGIIFGIFWNIVRGHHPDAALEKLESHGTKLGAVGFSLVGLRALRGTGLEFSLAVATLNGLFGWWLARRFIAETKRAAERL